MSGASELRSLTQGSFRYLPVLPGCMEFAVEVRRVLLETRPRVVAVELPVSLEDEFLRAVDRLPQITVMVWPEGSDPDGEENLIYLPVEPADPFIEAIRTAVEIGAEVFFLEPDLPGRPHIPSHAPDSFAIHFIGYDRYVELYRLTPPRRTPALSASSAGMAWKLQGADPAADTIIVVSLNTLDALLEAAEIPQNQPEPAPRKDVHFLNPHPDCLAEILSEYPLLQDRFEQFRIDPEGTVIERPRVQLEVLRIAEESYARNTGDKIVHWHRRLIARYTRNLAVLGGDLTAGLFEMATAAHGIVDDNYAWEVWEAGNRYAAQQIDSDVETAQISGSQVWLNSRFLRLRRRLPRFKQRVRPSALKKRKKEKYPGEWAEQLDGSSICSYPPEDLQVENYGRFLKQAAKSLISEERNRIEPFSSSLLDGIDLRETVRNWHKKKIYVRQQNRMAGEVGSVVLIFDQDLEDRYNYLTTWLGEHQNESDMAFYATQPFDHIVGPGIGRAEYGGFLMTLPPRRMFDVWSDPDYDAAETKAERLLMAGIDYSTEKLVVYVAAKPPRSVFRTYAAQLGHQILYIPIGQLSPAKLKKTRVVHVLDGHARREEAKDYIW